jgi:hypothetical protein
MFRCIRTLRRLGVKRTFGAFNNCGSDVRGVLLKTTE